ncbi:hypothetical protein QZH45_04960 [Pseudomonas corrugata]|uniref:hypothetical protein n=1 Tax=Pseudomonas corrugata TaxID=47879 RepID=UPI00083D938D|nr:hypothetical protein [Pseudomonas corrugata]AOE63806.1 hypothetical protein AXG94_19255 [Pseudomonas corrugata]
MDPLDIEDTGDWLGCPTPLEMYRHSCLMLENEVQELTTQLRKARQDIFGLIEMHAAEVKECARLRAELAKIRRKLSDQYRENTELSNSTRSELLGQDALIAELYKRLKVFEGDRLPDVRTGKNRS